MKYRAYRKIDSEDASIGPERENRQDARADMNQYVDAMKTGETTARADDTEWITFYHNSRLIHAFVEIIIE